MQAIGENKDFMQLPIARHLEIKQYCISMIVLRDMNFY